MSTTAPPRTLAATSPDRATARTTGLLYAGLAVTGMLGFLLVRPQLFDPDDPSATPANLLAHESLARAGIVLELGIVLTQALAALWFYRLFREVDGFAAGAVAVFGMVNATAILASAAFTATALEVALDPVAGEGTSQLMYVVSENLWGVGSLFFGLWLIPMGVLVLRSGWAPRALGHLLVGGGVGYIMSVLAAYLLADPPAALATVLVLPATAGELWMIGWLLVRGLRRR